MTTRNEPTLNAANTGNFLTSASNFVLGKTKVSHTQLVDDALDAFTKAEVKMVSAIDQIQKDITVEEQAIAESRNRIIEAGVSKDKLTRVLERVKALTA